MFHRQKTIIKETVDAKKNKLTGAESWDLIKNAREIIVGRGKKYEVFVPTDANRDDILSRCLGRTGNLRAPALKIGDRFIIGFNDDMFQEFID